MNAADILKYGHLTVLRTIEGLPQSEWETQGVCGWWSVKDIIAHLASYELLLGEVLCGFLGGGPTPLLNKFTTPGLDFNDTEVAARQDRGATEVLAEYNEAHTYVMSLIPQIPPEVLSRPGTLPWYGLEYAVDDYIVYGFYGHKREHSAQIAVFRDRIQK